MKNSDFSFWLRISEILLLKWNLKDPMTPTSVMMCFWSGCQVEGLWCEPHQELTWIFQLHLRECFQNEWWRCLFLGIFFFKWDSIFYQNGTESPLLWTAQPENAAAPLLCLPSVSSRFNHRKCRGIPAQLIPPFSSPSTQCLQGGSGKPPGEGSSEALLGEGRTFIYMKTPNLFLIFF